MIEVKIERDTSCCVKTPNVHDCDAVGLDISLKGRVVVSFAKPEAIYQFVVDEVSYFSVNGFFQDSTITEIFTGSLPELSEINFPRGEDPWTLSHPTDLPSQYLEVRRSNSQNNIIFFVSFEKGSYISIVGQKLTVFKLPELQR